MALAALQEVHRKDQEAVLVEVALAEVALEEVALVEVALEEAALVEVGHMEITARTEQMLRQKLQ